MTELATLAIPADVEAAMRRPLLPEEAELVLSLLITASARVEGATGGRKFLPGDYTVDGVPDSRGRVWLCGPATCEVTEVRDVDEDDGTEEVLVVGSDYTVRGRRLYGLRGHERVAVDFTIPISMDVPADVAKVTAGIVAGTLSGPPVGASAESAGSFSISYVDSSGRVFLSKSDRAILARYRDPSPAIDVLA